MASVNLFKATQSTLTLATLCSTLFFHNLAFSNTNNLTSEPQTEVEKAEQATNADNQAAALQELLGGTEETAKKVAKPELKLSADEIASIMDEMVYVEGGSFIMGVDDEDAPKRIKPAHEVHVDSFSIGKTELTQKLFSRVMGWNMSYFQCETCAVNNVSWFQMQIFIRKLNKATGRVFRLPTEAEWEYAARGGKKSKGYQFSGSNNIDDVAWYAGNAERKSQPVALKQPNELGLYDMTGNLWEFCHDDMSLNGYQSKQHITPQEIAKEDLKRKALKVLRGGGYEFDADETNVYYRDGATNNVRMPDIGFRLALNPK